MFSCFLFNFSGNELEKKVLQELPTLEIYNSKFTSNFGEWALGFCGGVYDKVNPGSIDLPDRPLQQVTDLDLSDRCIQNLINKVRLSSIVFIVFLSLFTTLLSLLSKSDTTICTIKGKQLIFGSNCHAYIIGQ